MLHEVKKIKDYNYNLETDMGDRMRFIREVVFSLSQTEFGKYMEVLNSFNLGARKIAMSLS